MALADIRKKIEGEAEAKAEQILADAGKQAQAVASQADADVASAASHYEKLLTSEAPEIKRRAMIVAGLDVQRLMLGARRDLMDRAVDGSLDVLASVDTKKYLAFMEKLLDQAVVEGNEELVVGKGEKAMTSQWLDEYNAAKGHSIVMASDKADIRGGFILRRGRISENCSLETLVRWLKDDLESDLTARLFAEK